MASGRMRLAMGLTIVGAVLLITGLLMVFVSEALRLKSEHSGPGTVRAGEFVAVCGLGIGVALLVALTVGRADRGGGRRRRAGGGAAGPRHDPAEEWLSPLHAPGVGLVPHRVLPSWPEPGRPASGDYADDGWHPDMADRWSPGPAWTPDRGDDRDRGEGADWGPVGEGDWNPAALAGITAWSSDELGQPGGNGHQPSPVTGPQTGYVTGPRRVHMNAPEPGYASGPEPLYLAGPEPGYLTGREVAYLTAGPKSGPATVARSTSEPGTVNPAAASSAPAEPDATRQDDDTSPIPVIRGTGQPGPEPGQREPAPAEPFSVWEPRQREPAPADPFSVWEPRQREPAPAEPFSVWEPRQREPAPAEPFSAWEPRQREPAPAEPVSVGEPAAASTQEKLEQIKDLYLTAEAIGEDALVKHFDQLSQRQRALIREYFERAGLQPTRASTPLGDDSAPDGASLPG